MAHELNVTKTNQTHRHNLPLDTDEISQARVDLAACLRMAARLGLEEGICNHFSAVVPGHPDLFIVNRLGWAFQEATASSLLICDFEGNVVAGDGVPEATAFFIHARLHKMVPRVGAAFHTHMPNATALSMVEGEPLVWAGQTALKFYGRVAVDENYNGLALDESEGDRIASVLGEKDILFMRNHGVMVCAPNIAEAWDDLYYLERAAEVQLKAMGSGRELLPVLPAVADEAARQMREGDPESARFHLESIRRVLDRHAPEYRD
jgi:ribulose-5-phosphate 4-epimerase/fuculose-1-phosphate aldolase